MKYKLLKVIDTAGLSFLSPVVRLVTGEEPRKQLQDIARFILVPTITFLAFLWLWSVVAPKHKTKAGEVPTPSVVWDAAHGIWRFHDRESAKEQGFLLIGSARESELQRATARLKEVEELETRAQQQLATIRDRSKERFETAVAPAKTAYDRKRDDYRQFRTQQAAELKDEAALLRHSDSATRQEFLTKLRRNAETEEALKAEVDRLKAVYSEAQELTFPEVKQAMRAATLLGEEKQFLTKYLDMLGESSREEKLATAEQRLEDTRSRFLSTTDEDLYKLGTNLLKQEDFLSTTADSRYAKPWTLPKQIVRSLLCVFTGFLIASAIAIPIGILCGLSPTFMAAVTPFIALFKPVSPLVWLPIVMIIVGGFMPDPENHWLVVALSKVPFIKNYGIDPMFISSAITVALCSLWATLVNTALGVGSIDKDHMNVARVLRLNFTSRLFKIIVPTALPLIFAGLRISLGVGWMVLVAAEILSTSEGIGKFVNDMYTNGSSQSFAQMFVVVFIVGFIGMLLDRIMVFLQRLVSFDTAPAL
ncbi:nitrate/nitrite transport system permease protein [Haloferula luteola]|uniref:Nitrate/nitrite transport system permease protein n=1 Tax=Haloferula luteola TaxID=595692 RepID=A0A840UX49_9BACT|nr:ABC transporter permease [Haloferula luteola]MBB5350727.1 nitrate/nitrite transport system permease protein [Haloferula luteola]